MARLIRTGPADIGTGPAATPARALGMPGEPLEEAR
jgi:hypothetical protein